MVGVHVGTKKPGFLKEDLPGSGKAPVSNTTLPVESQKPGFCFVPNPRDIVTWHWYKVPGWLPRYSLEEGLRETLEWYREFLI